MIIPLHDKLLTDDYVSLICDKANLTRITGYLNTRKTDYVVFYQSGQYCVIFEATVDLAYMNRKLKNIDYTVET